MKITYRNQKLLICCLPVSLILQSWSFTVMVLFNLPSSVYPNLNFLNLSCSALLQYLLSLYFVAQHLLPVHSFLSRHELQVVTYLLHLVGKHLKYM